MMICPDNGTGNNPAVTVVIAAYNSAHYISQALDSVRAQTFSDYEVIVVNDGSEDGVELERILQSHSLPVIYLAQENKGVSAARNAAIKIARGEFYAQLDADDQWTPDYLEVQLGILKNNPDVAVVYPNATIIGDSTDAGLEFMKISPSAGEVTFESLVRQQCVVMTCVTTRVSIIRAAGLYDEELHSCEDFDLWLRIAKSGLRIVYHRRPLVLYRRHAGSLSSDRVWMARHILAVYEKCLRTLQLTEAEAASVAEEINQSRSLLHLYEGKRALSAGNAKAARANFDQANEYLRSRKLRLVIFLLRLMPQFVVRVFTAREFLWTRQPDSKLTGIDHPRIS